MKILYLVRHAKSSWDAPDLLDHLRPLTRRGRSDAQIMGTLLREREASPAVIFSSTAVRALETSTILARALGLATDAIRLEAAIYEASTAALVRIVGQLPAHIDSALLVGHNPGITACASLLHGSPVPLLPTCGIVGLESPHASWTEMAASRTCRMVCFDVPKDHRR